MEVAIFFIIIAAMAGIILYLDKSIFSGEYKSIDTFTKNNDRTFKDIRKENDLSVLNDKNTVVSKLID